MSIDKIGLRLSTGEFKVIRKGKREIRHNYLYSAEKAGQAQFYNGKPYYMPYINIFSNHNKITEVQIDACPSKLVFGHNLQELGYNDLDTMLDLLVADLEYAGIYTNKEVLRQKPLNKLDVNKLMIWPNKMDIITYIENSAKQGHFKNIINLYPNGGESINSNLKYRKLLIYDKSKQAESLEYLNQETMEFIENAVFTLFNIEFQMKYKKEIDAELKTNNIHLKNTLENAFNPLVAETILLNRVNGYFKNIFLTSDDEETIKEKVKTYCKKTNKKGFEKITSLIGLALMAKNPDFKNELLEFSDRNTVSKKLKELKEINLTPVKSIEEFKELVIKSIKKNSPITLDYLKELDNRLKCKESYAKPPYDIVFNNSLGAV